MIPWYMYIKHSGQPTLARVMRHVIGARQVISSSSSYTYFYSYMKINILYNFVIILLVYVYIVLQSHSGGYSCSRYHYTIMFAAHTGPFPLYYRYLFLRSQRVFTLISLYKIHILSAFSFINRTARLLFHFTPSLKNKQL